jgi:hypothetical protein
MAIVLGADGLLIVEDTKPGLIGTRWVARESFDPGGFDHVVLTGMWERAEGDPEVIYTPVAHGPVFTASRDDFLRVYTREPDTQEADHFAAIAAKLDTLDAESAP